MSDKKRCPFCGDLGRVAEYRTDALFLGAGEQMMYTVVCAGGCCRMCEYSKTPEAALAKWNTRKGDA